MKDKILQYLNKRLEYYNTMDLSFMEDNEEAMILGKIDILEDVIDDISNERFE